MEVNIWLLLAVLATVSTTILGDDFSCSGLQASHACSCSRGERGENELICPSHEPTMILNYKPKDYVKLVCTSSVKPGHWNETRRLLSDLNLGKVHSFLVRMCPGLPSYPFKELLWDMGVPSIEAFHLVHMSHPVDQVTRSHFRGLEAIKQLDLNSNRLTYLPEDLFYDLSNLTWLDLKNNRAILPKGIFRSVPKLEVLELGSNNLTSLEPGIFRNLTRLRLLNLWGNRLQNLTRSVFTDVPNTESLDLNSNRLVSLVPDLFADLTNLKSLNLFNNDFISLPRGLFLSNPNLEKLQLNHNRRTLRLPPGLLSNLRHLKEVKLSNCNLTSLPEDLFWGSTSLTNLTLKYNQLTQIPPTLFKDNRELLSLDLSHNQLEEIHPDAFKDLDKLVDLNVGYNNLSNIPQTLLNHLTNLLKVNFEWNQVHHISDLSFGDLSELRLINFAHNNLSDIRVNFIDNDEETQSVFYNCVRLEHLNLSHNRLKIVYDDWKTKAMLKTLDLSYNQFTNISFEDMALLGAFLVMDLSYNNISVVDLENAEAKSIWFNEETGVISTDRLENRSVRVKLKGNPIKCDCRAYNLIRYLKGNMAPEVNYKIELDTTGVTCQGEAEEDIGKVDLRLLTCRTDLCPTQCSCQLRPHDLAFLVDCSGQNLTAPPSQLPAPPKTNHTVIDLSNNLLTSFMLSRGDGYNRTTRLYLSNNKISRLNITGFNPALEMIALDNNNLTRLDDLSLSLLTKARSLRWITLYNNPWACDCKTKELLNFLQTSYSKIGLLKNITCWNTGSSLSNMTLSELCPTSNLAIGLGSLLMALLGLFIGGTIAFYYRYQKEIKIWLYAHNLCLWFVTEEELDKDKQYDAFISYSHQDEQFVSDKLVPGLESGANKYKLCLHYRDWVVGDFIPHQIARSVEESKRTVVVLSPSFLESIWGRMEFRTAHQQALNEGRNRVIVIIYGDIPPTDKLDPELKAYLTMNTYIKWGDPWFWERLRYALPHPTKAQTSVPMVVPRNEKTDKSNLINGSTHSIPADAKPV